MLENLYTTKMSSSKRVLQRRFTKIRSKSGRAAKAAALAVTIALTVTAAAATVAMAAVGNDGLDEIHYETEIYYNSGMEFTVQVDKQNVPQWVINLCGSSDELKIRLMQGEDKIRGYVHDMADLIISGESGSVTLTGKFGGWLLEPLPEEIQLENHITDSYKDHNMYRFSFERNRNGEKWQTAAVELILDENDEILDVRVKFDMHSLSAYPWFDEIYTHYADLSTVSYIGDFRKMLDYKSGDTEHFFTSYEEHYQNRKIDAVKVKLVSADSREIVFDIQTDYNLLPSFKAYDENGKYLWFAEEEETDLPDGKKRYVITHNTKEQELENGDTVLLPDENGFKKGKTYRVDIGFIRFITRENGSGYGEIPYRWREFVTIE